MSSFNNPSNFNNPFTPKAQTRKISPFVIGGGILLVLVCGIGNLTGSARGPQNNQAPMTAQYNNNRSLDNGQTGSNASDLADQNPSDMADQTPSENGYIPQGANYPSTSDQTPSTGYTDNQAPSTSSDAMDNGYAEREKAQDQSAQAFDGYIRDTDTVRDTENGQVYTDVPNDQADSAIQSGAATEVPTAELPTSGDSGAASTPDTSASDAPAAE